MDKQTYKRMYWCIYETEKAIILRQYVLYSEYHLLLPAPQYTHYLYEFMDKNCWWKCMIRRR